jgi:6-pyruvoyltetrahydropterin/6-carboxytetrahydropterin synthase
MILLKRTETFAASHRLFNPQWSDEKNFEVFGKCARPNGHGHNYKLEVSVGGELDAESGMVFDLQVLKSIIQEEVLNDVDHHHLNFDVPWLAGKNPTTEIVVEAIWQRLEKKIAAARPKAFLHTVTLWETEKNVVIKTVG